MKKDEKKDKGHTLGSVSKNGPSDKTFLEQMIARHPPILRARVIKALRKLEVAIEYEKAAGDPAYWLERYRSKIEGSAVPWFGLYPQLDGCVQELDSAYRAIHEYRPEDYIASDARKEITESAVRNERKKHALEGAKAKLSKDISQEDRALVRECWESWQKRPDLYKTKAAFARDMLTKCEKVCSQAVIARWCTKWEREKRIQQAQ